MKKTIVCALLLIGTAFGQVASGTPTFKGHKVGETAQEFFAIAKMAETKGILTVDYCRAYLSDPKVQKAWQKAQRNKMQANGMDWGADFRSVDVTGCNDVNAALSGKDTQLGFRYANEFGPGSAQFLAGKLAAISFSVEAKFDDVVADMSTKLGTPPSMDAETLQNGFGAKLTQRKATWLNAGSLTAIVTESKSFRYGDMGISVVVADSNALKKLEDKRQASRPKTLD